MFLGDLAGIDSDVAVTGAAIDSRKVTAGCLFGAFPGSVHNGEDFIASAVERGAVAVVARPEAFVDGA
ncbi:MAG: Mur ligase domain-containing protein, partial [Pseudomonadota bacterium]|nr:Mur ligase domain-containing protein [Pseudomonadota bacterium]